MKVLRYLTLSAGLAGCIFSEPKDPTGVLERCRAEARADYYVGQISLEEAMRRYDLCVSRGGV